MFINDLFTHKSEPDIKRNAVLYVFMNFDCFILTKYLLNSHKEIF